jgi:hypothetical protein
LVLPGICAGVRRGEEQVPISQKQPGQDETGRNEHHAGKCDRKPPDGAFAWAVSRIVLAMAAHDRRIRPFSLLRNQFGMPVARRLRKRLQQALAVLVE